MRRLAICLLLLLIAGCIPGPRTARTPQPLPAPALPQEPPAPERSARRQSDVPPPLEKVGEVEMPPSAPALARAAVTPNAVESVGGRYTVVRGDTLRRIAEKTGAASEAIARENRLAPPFLIRAGQRLTIPAGRWHIVRAGQNGIAIARAYGVEWTRIVALNDLEEPYILRTGQRLRLPSTSEVAEMSVEARAAAFRLDIEDLITGAEPAIAANRRVAPPVTRPTRPLSPDTAVGEPTRFAGRFGWPLDGAILTRFGRMGSGLASDGITISAPRGTPVAASADGVVAYVGSEIAALGGLVLVRHGDGWTTVYANADTILVTRGQKVKRGQTIALSGESGGAQRPQLHFEIRRGRTAVDPLKHLPRRA